MAATSTHSAPYVLPRDANERDRLNLQHHLVVAAFQSRLLHPSIVLPEGYSALDSGTGTGIFLSALGDQTGHSTKPSQLVGSDMSTVQFPAPEDATFVDSTGRRCRIDFFQHDVLQRFPDEHLEKYDLVHQRFLVGGVNMEAWPRVIDNLLQTVRPGGFVQLVEMNIDWSIIPPSESSSFITAMQLSSALFDGSGKDRRIVFKLEDMLKNRGFCGTETVMVPFPMGPKAEELGLQKDFGDANADNTLRIYKSMWSVLNGVGGLTNLPEIIQTEHGRDVWLEQFAKDLASEGNCAEVGIVVGRKSAA